MIKYIKYLHIYNKLNFNYVYRFDLLIGLGSRVKTVYLLHEVCSLLVKHLGLENSRRHIRSRSVLGAGVIRDRFIVATFSVVGDTGVVFFLMSEH